MGLFRYFILMKSLVSFIYISILSICYSQKQAPESRIFLELGGSGGLASFNYERPFHTIRKSEFTWRTGLSVAPIDKNNGIGLVVPIMMNGLFGNHAHKFEVGIGQGITVTTKGSFFALSTLNIGYRYQSLKSPWFYRITYTPLISYWVDFQYQNWCGVSIGYRLNRQPS